MSQDTADTIQSTPEDYKYEISVQKQKLKLLRDAYKEQSSQKD